MSKVTYNEIRPHPLDFNDSEWHSLLERELPDRNHYSFQGMTYHFGQVASRFLGTQHDEDEYVEMLYLLSTDERKKIIVLSEELNKQIDNDRFQAIQRVFMTHQNENLSINRFVAFLEGEALLPNHRNPALHRHIRLMLSKTIDIFHHRHANGLAHPDFRRFIVDMIKWVWNHLDPWIHNKDIKMEFPHVLWYGESTKSEGYFLYYLMLLGCDVLIFYPEGQDFFAEIDPDNTVSSVYRYPSKNPEKSFPKSKPIRSSTVAYKATKEIENVLHHDNSLIYKPWQFRSYVPHSITLKTTYDEVFLMVKERAFIRPNFKVEDRVVTIPSLFTKIAGVSNNKKEYWDRLLAINEGDLTISIKSFPLTKEVKGNYQYHYKSALGRDGKLIPEKLMENNWWKYGHLPNGLQYGIASGIAKCCDEVKLKAFSGESTLDVQIYLFQQATDIPDEFLKILQKFDYSQEIPRVVLYNTELNGELSRTDAALLLLLNTLGIDIILYNPPGHNDLERFIDETHYDVHWLEEIAFEQEFKEPSFISSLLNKIKFLK